MFGKIPQNAISFSSSLGSSKRQGTTLPESNLTYKIALLVKKLVSISFQMHQIPEKITLAFVYVLAQNKAHNFKQSTALKALNTDAFHIFKALNTSGSKDPLRTLQDKVCTNNLLILLLHATANIIIQPLQIYFNKGNSQASVFCFVIC